MGSGAGVEAGQVRLAELVAALSLGIDLGFGQPMEHVLRQCRIALRLLGSGSAPLNRFRIAVEFALSGHRDVSDMIAQHARMARLLAEQLDLPVAVQEGVGSAYEQWDGHGWPGALAGTDVPIASRIAQLSEYVEVAHRVGGIGAARAVGKRRSGKQVDPMLADVLQSAADELLADIGAPMTWDSVIAHEPALAVRLSPQQFDAALAAIANFVDLKSPYTLGHATAVGELAQESARVSGLSQPDIRLLYRAGLVHGFGRLGVSNAIWDRAGALNAGEWERVRMYPYLTERMLYQSEALAPLGRIAVQHRERLDGSGYPRGLSGGSISRPARILAAAEAYQTKREPRPHRPVQPAAEAARHLRHEVNAGRLDAEAVDAVLRAAGHRVSRRVEGPAGLTNREVEVLRLLARGQSNKQIAERLVITPKTTGNHIEHIYTKIQASTRAAAALFALQHGLLPEEEIRTGSPGWHGLPPVDVE